MTFCSHYLNAIGASDRHSHCHSDGWDEAETVQQRQAETFSMISGCDAGETWAAPERKATCRTICGKSVTIQRKRRRNLPIR